VQFYDAFVDLMTDINPIIIQFIISKDFTQHYYDIKRIDTEHQCSSKIMLTNDINNDQ